MNQEQLEIDLIRKVIAKKNYKFFSNGIFNLNIIGIRTPNRKAGVFDDWMVCIYKDEHKQWRCKQWKITTDAGTFWLEHPMNVKGTALLVPNQHSKCWKIGLHKGKYKALVQCEAVTVYRDNNHDRIEDFKASSIECGNFGINIHRSNPVRASVVNDKWSAGCQVFSNPEDFAEFMALVEKSSAAFGDIFTYTLLETEDFNEL